MGTTTTEHFHVQVSFVIKVDCMVYYVKNTLYSITMDVYCQISMLACLVAAIIFTYNYEVQDVRSFISALDHINLITVLVSD